MRPGWKTTEAWLTGLVAMLVALQESGLLPHASQAERIVGLIVAGAAVLGYTGARAHVKGRAAAGETATSSSKTVIAGGTLGGKVTVTEGWEGDVDDSGQEKD